MKSEQAWHNELWDFIPADEPTVRFLAAVTGSKGSAIVSHAKSLNVWLPLQSRL